jgi:hypothetical protein
MTCYRRRPPAMIDLLDSSDDFKIEDGDRFPWHIVDRSRLGDDSQIWRKTQWFFADFCPASIDDTRRKHGGNDRTTFVINRRSTSLWLDGIAMKVIVMNEVKL